MFVIDEHGGMEGILTLEDLLEEIVGEINDEYDEEVREQISKDGATYVLDGLLAVRDANRSLRLDLPGDDSYTTIAGFLMARSGRMLKSGDKVEHSSGLFEIERVENRRISRIRFTPRAVVKEAAKTPILNCLLGLLVTSHAVVPFTDAVVY
jgi:CBS domain containing-hemolysin-like protein